MKILVTQRRASSPGTPCAESTLTSFSFLLMASSSSSSLYSLSQKPSPDYGLDKFDFCQRIVACGSTLSIRSLAKDHIPGYFKFVPLPEELDGDVEEEQERVKETGNSDVLRVSQLQKKFRNLEAVRWISATMMLVLKKMISRQAFDIWSEARRVLWPARDQWGGKDDNF